VDTKAGAAGNLRGLQLRARRVQLRGMGMAPTGSPPEQRAEVRSIETVWKPRSELVIRGR
jgi:hypothetical protein